MIKSPNIDKLDSQADRFISKTIKGIGAAALCVSLALELKGIWFVDGGEVVRGLLGGFTGVGSMAAGEVYAANALDIQEFYKQLTTEDLG